MIYISTLPIITTSLFLFIYLKRKRISVANPSNIATVGWVIPFLMTSLLTLSPHYEDWRPGIYLILSISLAHLAFTSGNLIGYKILKPRQLYPCQDLNDKNEGTPNIKFRKQAYFIFTCGLIGYINNIANIVNAGGLNIYTEHGLREAELAFGSNTIFNYLYFLNIMTLLMFIYLRHIKLEKRKIDLLIIAISFFALLSHGVKGTIVWPLVMTFVLIHSNKKHILWNIIWPTIIFIMLIFLIVTLGRELPSIVSNKSDLNDWLIKGLLNFPLYFSTGFVNLEIELIKFTDFAFGLNTLAPFYEVFSFFLGNRKSLDVTEASDELLYFHAYNTATYLRDPFRDFGFIGIIIFPLFYGITTALLFGLSSRPSNPYAKIAYSIYAAAIFGMFFSNHFQKTQYIFLIIICLLLSITNRRGPKRNK